MHAARGEPLKTVLISGVDITLLPDSGATVNAMDEATFKKCGLDKRVRVRKSRCQIKPYGAASKANMHMFLNSGYDLKIVCLSIHNEQNI